MFTSKLLRTVTVRPNTLNSFGIRCFAALSQSTIDTVKATAPVLAEHGYAITKTMYKKMLSENSEVKALFNPTHQVELPGEERARQPWSLACAVHAYAAHVDDLGALTEAVERIAQKHVSLQVLPEHYPVVGEHLLWAIKEVLGDGATPEVMKAWGEAYGFLADIFIARETDLRESKAKEVGGWKGWREFEVKDKVVESDEICSIYMKPKDNGKLPNFFPGQYIAVRIENEKFTTQRNYTLSSSPDSDNFRITVKREPPLTKDCPAGQISNYIHNSLNVGESIKVGVPCGDFVLEVKNDKPIVLLSGGVGVTPIISMLEHLLHEKVKNNIIVINTSRSPKVEAMHGLLRKYRRKHLNLIVKTLYDDATDDYPKSPLTEEQLSQILVSKDSNYYFCGATGFMKNVFGILKKWEIPQSQIHFEFFGPHQDLE